MPIKNIIELTPGDTVIFSNGSEQEVDTLRQYGTYRLRERVRGTAIDQRPYSRVSFKSGLVKFYDDTPVNGRFRNASDHDAVDYIAESDIFHVLKTSVSKHTPVMESIAL